MFAVENQRNPTVRAAAGRLARAGLAAAALLAFVGARAADMPGAITEKPLAQRPFARGKTMFVELAPEDTGVRTENRYDDPKMWGEFYQEFEFGAIGSGVAIGDFDGDGRPDLFVVSKTGRCWLFRNLGGYRFEDVTEKAGVGGASAPGVWTQGATFVDINNSGRLNLYVCRFNAPNLLYINQGDGTFKEQAHAYGLDVADASGMASFCDYTREGWLDLYIATNLLDNSRHPNGQRGYLFHNNRNGTFTNVTDSAGIGGESQSHSATWWDFDNDGWPDLYVANDYGAPDKLYHNNRDGTFTDALDQALPHTSFSSMGSDLGDVNNDGLIDFIVADMAFTSHPIDQRGQAEERAKTGEPPDSSSAAPKYHRNALFINTGTGRSLEAANLAGIAATDWTWSVRLEDLDNDGRLDLYVANGMNKEENTDLTARMAKAESTAERIQIMRASPLLAETHLAFRNRGDLQFQEVGTEWGLDQKGVAFGAAFGDLSGDGNLDLVYTNYKGGVTVLRNDCDTGHVVNVDLRGTLSNRYGIGSTVKIESALGTQVRQLWLARGYLSSSEPMVHFGLGSDTVVNRLTVTWPSGQVQAFDHLPVDRRFTVTEPASPVPGIAAPKAAAPKQFEEVSQASGLSLASREESVDELSPQRLLPVRLNRRGPALAVGDVFGNGRDDVVLGGTSLDPLRILQSTGPGQFKQAEAPAWAAAGGADDGPILLFDSRSKGTQDLLLTKGGNALPAEDPGYQPKLFLNDGHGGFTPAPDNALPALPISVGAVAAADFNRDGNLDLFIGGRVIPGQYPLAPRSALLVNRGGTFEDATDRLAPGLRGVGMVTSALWTDVDGDGWADLLLTLEWGHVRYFHNNQGKGFEEWTGRSGFASAGTGWWTSIAAADLNGDGRIDYVVGNVGLNTQYHASPERPAVLFSGDFTGRGGSQLIEGYYEGDRLFPWRSRHDLGAAISSVLKRYPRNDSYSLATLADILGADKLAAANRFAATELRSGVFMSQPDGTFTFEPLPRIAQISPLQGMVAGDFSGEGRPEIYAVQNSYAPIPAVGRFDGGLSQLLRTDGHGHLSAVPVAASNLVVPGDAKALAVLDMDQDGWPGFVVSRNNATVLAFRNHGSDGRRPLRVVLRGPAGNPTGVGARITVEFSDGSAQASEVYAGSGYYSQSTSACFFGYPQSTPPTKIRVRWPSGKSTESPVLAPSATVTISESPADAQP
jgi:hypothetical protein